MYTQCHRRSTLDTSVAPVSWDLNCGEYAKVSSTACSRLPNAARCAYQLALYQNSPELGNHNAVAEAQVCLTCSVKFRALLCRMGMTPPPCLAVSPALTRGPKAELSLPVSLYERCYLLALD